MNRFPSRLILAAAAALVGVALMAGTADAESAEEGSDLWLQSKILTTYTLNEHLSPFDIQVQVKKGIAYLSGAVETSVQKDLAGAIAQGVTGIRDVENGIRVDADETGTGDESGGFLRTVKDATLTARVKSNLLWNRNTSGIDISVASDNGTVTLSGTVDSAARRDLAVQIARNTKGVSEVISRLTVDPETLAREKENSALNQTKQAVSDTWITTKVKTMLLFSKAAEGAEIDVSTEKGMVTLSGTAPSAAQKGRIVELVGNVVQVQGVTDRLRVEK